MRRWGGIDALIESVHSKPDQIRLLPGLAILTD